MMFAFPEIALKAINSYKVLLRRLCSNEIYSQKIAALNLRRIQIRKVNSPGDDLYLYNTVLAMTADMEKYIEQDIGNKTRKYYGATRFLQNLRAILSDYKIEDGRVIHVISTAACAIVEAVQLITLPENKLTQEVLDRLCRAITTISKYGSIEHVAILNDAIKKHRSTMSTFLKKHGKTLRFENFLVQI